ncbi:MAG TPA: HRDC domain-containing protein [Kofleriaceae bacterium]|nr:HRDC domain-containing protein [Kofleriaceae bacterium]
MSASVVVEKDHEAVSAIVAAIAGASLVAFDLEFLAQDRLVPTLCLVQVAWCEKWEHGMSDAPPAGIDAPSVRLIDPLAVDVAPVVRALAAHPCVIAHAPRQDLALLAARFGVAMPSVIDTQLMAAFAGIGDQIGFAALANELLGLALGKEQQWTDWAARPLSAAQLAYAAADVRHLPAIYAKLAARLGERLAWARAESALVAAEAEAAAAVTPETAWRQVAGLRGLDAASLAAVVALAAWRQRVCIELDRPLGQVVNDKLLVELARQRPATATAVRAVKGMTGLGRQRADDIIAAIAAARPGEVTTIAAARPPSPRAQRWSELLLAIVQLVADDLKLAPRLLATRSDAEELARAVDERGLAACDHLPAMTGWRRAVLGDPWRHWLTGSLVLVGDLRAPQGIRLIAPARQ